MRILHLYAGYIYICIIPLLFGLMSPYVHAQSGCPIVIESIEQSQEICNLNNGSIEVVATGGQGPLLYSIDGGITTQNNGSFEGLNSGDYVILITDTIACSELVSIQIANAPEPVLTLDHDCVPGENAVDLDMTPFDGILPYTFIWAGPDGFTSQDEDLYDILPGEYSVTVIDALNCMSDTTILIQPCCSFTVSCTEDIIPVPCFGEVPDIFRDSLFETTSDMAVLTTMGISISSDCNEIRVTVEDSLSQVEDCLTDTLFVHRRFYISDGIDETVCALRYAVDHYTSLLVIDPAEDMTVDCSVNVDSLFQQWIASYGGARVEPCAQPLQVATVPAVPVLEYTCGGMAAASVTFILEDNCGHSDTLNAEFHVSDDDPPILYCPPDISFGYNSPMIQDSIDSWVAEFVAQDACGSVSLSNSGITYSFDGQCVISHEVVFSATDECGNTSSCVRTIEIEDRRPPSVNCPPPVTWSCEDVSSNTVSTWMAQASAFSADGAPLVYTSDFNPFAPLPDCGATLPITFRVLDTCGNRDSCWTSLTITDTIPPRLKCPRDITVALDDMKQWPSLQDWFSEVEHQDACGASALTRDSLLLDGSNECLADHIFTWTATDQCGNVTTCSSSVSMIRSNELELICPDTIELRCQDPLAPDIINQTIASVMVGSDLPYILEYNDMYDIMVTHCAIEVVTIIDVWVTDDCDNYQSCQIPVKWVPEAKIYIPNIISPNADNLNDRFTVFGNTSVLLVKELMIFDRWGSVIYQQRNFPANDPYYGWDGTKEGKALNSQVFTYKVIVEDRFNEHLHFSGTVQLLK